MATTPTRARRRQSPDETRSLILDSAERQLRERPFRELSVDSIMQPTGYRRTVFYRHFAGLPELVLAILATKVLPELTAANDAFGDVASQEIGDEEVRGIIRRVVETWERHGPLMSALRDAAVYDEQIEALVDRTLTQYVGMLAEVLAERQAAGWAGGAAPEQLAAALTGMNQRYLLDCFGGKRPRATVDEATDALTVVWSAVVTRAS